MSSKTRPMALMASGWTPTSRLRSAGVRLTRAILPQERRGRILQGDDPAPGNTSQWDCNRPSAGGWPADVALDFEILPQS